MTPGRPPGELTGEQEQILRLLGELIQSRERELAVLRMQLGSVAWAASQSGASLRAIGAVVGLSKSQIDRLIQTGRV